MNNPWIIQGGFGINATEGAIYLPKTMSNTRYNVSFGGSATSANHNVIIAGVLDRYKSYFNIQSNVVNSSGGSSGTTTSNTTWRVEGYIEA